MSSSTSAAVVSTIVSTQRIRPATRPSNKACSMPVPLMSINSLDAPAPTALLFYDSDAARALDPAALERSLSLTLSSYPHLAGRLRLCKPDDPGRPYTLRFRRTWIEWGRDDDPGVSLVFAHRDVPMAHVLPRPLQGFERVFQIDTVNDFSLGPKLAPSVLAPDSHEDDGPIAGAKVTTFSCGGAVLAFASSHAIFDAQALGTLLADWSRIHTALASGKSVTLPDRPFDSAALDAMAAGDLDADTIDPDLEALERTLSVFRYDSWARDDSGDPSKNPPLNMQPLLGPAPEVDAIDAARGRVRWQIPPWHLSHNHFPVNKYGIEFSAEDIDRMWIAAIPESLRSSTKLSRQDVFVAHLWKLVTRARGNGPSDVLDLGMACDNRRRLSTALPSTAPGCFNVCLGLQIRAEDLLSDEGVFNGATQVRRAINTISAPVLAAWLHRISHQIDPTREWILFGTDRSLCTTNWSRSPLYAVDFGSGRPVFAHNLVSAFGGFATIMGRPGSDESQKWYGAGVFIALWLEQDAMERLLADPQLRG